MRTTTKLTKTKATTNGRDGKRGKEETIATDEESVTNECEERKEGREERGRRKRARAFDLPRINTRLEIGVNQGRGRGRKGRMNVRWEEGANLLSPPNVISFFLQHFFFHSWNPQEEGEQRRQTDSVYLHGTVNSQLIDQPIRIQMERLMFKCPIGDVF